MDLSGYAMLATMIFCVLTAFMAGAVVLIALINETTVDDALSKSDRDIGLTHENVYSIRYWVALVAGVIGIAAGAGAYFCLKHLTVEAFSVLVFFGAWYAVGFASRFFMHVLRHEIMSKHFETHWDAVAGSLLWALFGPIETLVLLREFWEQKR